MSTINLLPDDYIKRRAQRRANMMCLVLFAVVMAGVIGAMIVSGQTVRNTEQVRDRVNTDYEEATKLIAQMQNLQAQKSTLMHKATLSGKLMERVPRSAVLAVLTNSRPEGTSLTTIKLDTKKIISGSGSSGSRSAKFASKAPTGNNQVSTSVELEITGTAGTDVQVAKFIANLARNPLVDIVDLVYSEERLVEKQKVREFRIRIELKVDADSIDLNSVAMDGEYSEKDFNAVFGKGDAI